MVGHVAAAVDLVQLHAALRKQLIAGEDVRAVSIAAQREHRRMLEQQQRVADQVLLARGDDLLLDRQALPRRGRDRDGGD